MNIVVILAGGVGSRMTSSQPKQFLIFNKKTCLEYTVSRFHNNKNIDDIVIVMHPDWVSYTKKLFEQSDIKCSIIPGGSNRTQSCYSALNFIQTCENIIFHDAVRPFITNKIINECLLTLNTFEAVTVAVPVIDTIIQVNDNQVITVPKRKEFFLNQTPQAFKFKSIKSAYDRAYQDNRELNEFSDDCEVFHKYYPQKVIKVINGEYSNIKLTTTIDAKIFQQIFLNESI